MKELSVIKNQYIDINWLQVIHLCAQPIQFLFAASRELGSVLGYNDK